MARTKSSTKKVFVIDTNVMLSDPSCLGRFADNHLMIPTAVLEELDKHKVGTNDINRSARSVIRQIDQILSNGKGSLEEGFPLEIITGSKKSGFLFVQTKATEQADSNLDKHKNDNLILACAQQCKIDFKTSEVYLVSKDINLRIKAKITGVLTEDYKNDHTLDDADFLATGIRHLEEKEFEKLVAAHLKSWAEGQYKLYEISQAKANPIRQNEMVIFPDGHQFMCVKSSPTQVTLKSLVDYQGKSNIWGIQAKNPGQNFALNLLMDPNIDLVTLLGPAGTGKTLLTLAAGLEMVVEKKKFGEIIFSRATVPMGEEIGFLPGTEEEKMAPWVGALDDNLDMLMGNNAGSEWGNSVNREMIKSRIKVKSMTFMRGRTFHNRFFILDEAQNLTPKQMKALITRAGPGTKVVCMGNLSQIDTPFITETSSGLTYAVEKLKGWEHHGSVILEAGERSRLATIANERL